MNGLAGGAGHDVLALDQRAHEPGFIAHQPELLRVAGQLDDDRGLRPPVQHRQHVTGVETAAQARHPARRFGARRLDVARRDAEHLVVQPGVDHRFAEAPLVADLDAGQRTVLDELQHRALVDAQVRRQLLDGHQAVFHRYGVLRRITLVVKERR
jgi:hypothetical protein